MTTTLLRISWISGDVPVATVGAGMGGPRNAGILAVQILALADDSLRQKLTAFKQKLSDKVAARNEALKKKIAEESQ